MNRRTWSWHSDALEREMKVGCWGHFGKPVVLFSTAAADYLDYERFLMMDALQELIDGGRIKVYCCDGAAHPWLDPEAHPAHKSWMQACFDRYVTEELLPFVSEDCGGIRGFVAAGASLGAYNSVNAACKHPDWFDAVIAMSGTYDFDRWMGRHRDLNYYYNQPLYFVPNMGPGPQLDALRRVRFVIATGQGRAEAPNESVRMADVLRVRGVPVDLEIWGEDQHHDWPTWRAMLPLFLDHLV